MARRKYVKENNLVKAINTDSLELQKPLVNEYYDINVHNSNMDKIDKGYRQNKNDISNINYELSKTENTKYTTANGIKEFSCKDGYVDNVAIEGKTLVNIAPMATVKGADSDGIVRTRFQAITDNFANNQRYSNNTFTFCNFTDKTIEYVGRNSTDNWGYSVVVDANSYKVVEVPSDKCVVGVDFRPSFGWSNADLSIYKSSMYAVLEGDHTDKPISYFEGLKSVGQGDKIDVLSYLSNTSNKIDLSNVVWKDGYYLANDFDTSDGRENMNNLYSYSETYIPIESNTTYLFKNVNLNFCFYDEYKQFIPTICEHPVIQIENISEGYFIKKTPINARYVRLVVLTKNKSIIEMYKDARYDKKTIPVTLRSLPNGVKDTIEKRGNRYVKVQRCGEYVITDTVIQSEAAHMVDLGTVVRLGCYLNTNLGNKIGDEVISLSDKFVYIPNYELDKEHFYISNTGTQTNFFLFIDKSKLNGTDIDTAKQYLRNNPLTIVYELENPIEEELPNFNPQTFEGDTTLLLNSGVIQAEADFEVTNSMGSEIEVLKGKVSSLDDDIQKAFQYGDNVKTQLVDKLISEGLDVSTNNTFEELIGKIALGKKWASGEVSGYSSSYSSFKTLAGETISCKYITISNLSFIPNTIVYIDVAMPQIGVYTNFANTYSGGKGTIVTNRFHSTSTTYTVTSIAVDENVLVSSSEIRLPFRTGTTSANTVKWIAFE